MGIKKWSINEIDRNIAKSFCNDLSIQPLLATVLASRGFEDAKTAFDFFSREADFSSPFSIADMEKAAAAIHEAINNGEKITVYGDYDCDGITATALLYTYLISVGADVSYYIPEREGDGYGLNITAIDKIAKDGTKMLITVDNGISAIDEVEYANSLGLSVVITDHHQSGDILPNAIAVVDPNRKDDRSGMGILAGVGVAFKLVAALENGDYTTTLEYFSDLAAVGTIGDIVPLVGENRMIVLKGLEALQLTENEGLNAIMNVAGINRDSSLTAQRVAYGIVPRINAAGRVENAGLAAELLLSEDSEKAGELAEKINGYNVKRQELEAEITKQAVEYITNNPDCLNGRVLVVKGENWHMGVIGIVAARLVDRYDKPAFIMSEHDGALTGSARSFGDFHLYQALASCKSGVLERFGGHKMAAGFSLNKESFDEFKSELERFAEENHKIMPVQELKIDAVLNGKLLSDEKSVQELSYLEPFGTNNPQPIFVIKNATIVNVAPLSGGKHQRIDLRLEEGKVSALCFNMPTERFFYKNGDMVDLAVTLEINTYNERTSVSAKVKDMRYSEFAQDSFFAAKACFEQILRDESITQGQKKSAVPSRDEAGVIYKWLKKNGGYDLDDQSLHMQTIESKINFCKLKVILSVLKELSLIKQDEGGRIEICEGVARVDLNSSALMRKLCVDMQND